MQIGELSRRTGVSVRMLRYYEGEGLLQPSRTGSGYRRYVGAEELTVRLIRMLSGAGLKVAAIRRVLPCVRSDDPDRPRFKPCRELRASLRREIEALDNRIDELRQSRRILAGYLGDLE